MIRLTIDVSDKTHTNLKLRLIQETTKNKKLNNKAGILSAQKFITDLLENELKIKK